MPKTLKFICRLFFSIYRKPIHSEPKAGIHQQKIDQRASFDRGASERTCACVWERKRKKKERNRRTYRQTDTVCINMSVLFAEMDRSGSVGSSAMNGGCGGSVVHSQPPQSQSSSSASSTNSAAGVNSLEEQRALQLAFELSMLGLSDSLPGCNGNGGPHGSDLNVNIGLNGVNSGCHQSPSSLSPGGSANGGINSVMTNNVGMSAFSSMMPSLEDRSKKSQNMTECVPVPSSEHVAEIVGRQGKFHINPIYLYTHLSHILKFNTFNINRLYGCLISCGCILPAHTNSSIQICFGWCCEDKHNDHINGTFGVAHSVIQHYRVIDIWVIKKRISSWAHFQCICTGIGWGEHIMFMVCISDANAMRMCICAHNWQFD